MLYQSTYPRYSESSNSEGQKIERWVPGAGGGCNGELVFNGDRVSVLQDEKSSGAGQW